MTFEARIVETFSRRVIIDASSKDEAEEILGDLCAEGEINLDYDDFSEREIQILGSIVVGSKPYLPLYDKSGKIL